MNYNKIFCLMFSLLLVACGDNNYRNPGHASSADFTFSLGKYVLFAINSEGELIQEAPYQITSNAANEYEDTVEQKLIYGKGSRVLAGLLQPNMFEISDYTFGTAPFTLQNKDCELGATLEKVSQLLARLSYSLERHTNVPSALARVNSCALKKALTCFLGELEIAPWDRYTSAFARGLTIKNIVANMQNCSEVKDMWVTNSYFEIKNQKMYFFPDPLYAIKVFEGKQTSYGAANDNLNSVAKIIGTTFNVDCLENCFSSPLPYADLFKCNTADNVCAPLVSGNTYTAFLQRHRTASEDSFAKVFFKAP